MKIAMQLASKAHHLRSTGFRDYSGWSSRDASDRVIINNLTDLDAYTADHELDGFVVEGRVYLLRSSERYSAYLKDGGLVTSMRRDPEKPPSFAHGCAHRDGALMEPA